MLQRIVYLGLNEVPALKQTDHIQSLLKSLKQKKKP